ncbi:hypothetical protein OESDEN_19781 [Oesophagostomum dentatum]|uniref:DUF1907 domain-containing protein n=1 Tax=Oesophagostomum dentatum TaxID=61180 RepID=A0A0B1S6J6_OESDE|nr:hypothetical protein OESDEN_19781 [Oesophagostomum dentatum]
MSWSSYIIKTFKPSNSELCSVLGAALKKSFKKVHVELTKCPDLTAAPFHMTGTGFGRNMVIAEVGGLGNLYPGFHKEKHYDLKVASKITTLAENKSVPFETKTINSTKFTLTGNFIVTAEPGPAEVVHIKCSERTGKLCFPDTLRESLEQRYGKECVVLGGLFRLLRGKARVHIAPEFPEKPWKSMDEVEHWYQPFVVSAPLLCASVMHSYDPGFKLRMQHTHCISDHNDAGHFENDATPEEAEYEGWFTAAEKMYRIDEI